MDFLIPYKKFIKWDELQDLDHKRLKYFRESKLYPLYETIEDLPRPKDYRVDLDQEYISFGSVGQLSSKQEMALKDHLKSHIPWKKGPFNFFGIKIDAEWRSNLKWQKIEHKIGSLKDQLVLDIGCNNGYFLFRICQQMPKLVLGIDPVLAFYVQFQLINYYAQKNNLHFKLWGVEHLRYFSNMYDTIFHMGIIYHHRHPIEQLIDIREALRPGGQGIIETIGIPGEDSIALFPEDRYAGMKNVWFIPTLSCLINWCKKARFIDIEIIYDSPLTNEEQRKTSWTGKDRQSLEDVLDLPQYKTIEGHPLPRRFCLLVKKKTY